MAKDHPTGQSGLYQAFLQLKTPEQCYRFLQDVCSYSELSAMEQRYNIAEMLVDKRIYTEIMDKTVPSPAGSAGCSVPTTACCAACWKRRNLPAKPKNEKLCRVPPGAACGFFVIRPGSSRFPPRGDPALPFSGENLHRRDIL